MLIYDMMRQSKLAGEKKFAMLIDPDKVESTPVLPGDASLYPINSNNEFRYFFQHHIANQIKSADPDAMAAISQLLEPQ